MSRTTSVSAIISAYGDGSYDELNTSNQISNYVSESRFNLSQEKFITLEKNYFYLDGGNDWNFIDYDGGERFGYFASDKSDIDGNFLINPYLLIELTDVQSSYTFQSWFQNSRILERKITFYDIAMTPVKEETITDEFTTSIDNYKFVKIEATKAVPFSYAKDLIYYIGGDIELGNENILEAKLISGTDISLQTLPISTISLKIVDTDGKFLLNTENSIIKYLKKRMPLIITYIIDGISHILFTMFISNIESTGKKVELSASCAMSIIDDVPNESKLYSNTKIKYILYDISLPLLENGIHLYMLDGIGEIRLSGQINSLTMREKLLYICLAAGAIMTKSGENLYIGYPKRIVSHSMSKSNKIDTKIKKTRFVSSVRVKYYNLVLAESEELVIRINVLANVEINLSFDAMFALTSYELVGEDRTSEGLFVQFVSEITYTPTFDGVYSLYGKKYTKTPMYVTESIDTTGLSDSGIVKETTSPLGTEEQARDLAKQLLNYYQLQQTITTKFLMDGTENLGDWAFVSDPDSEIKYIAGLEELDIDLAGGLIANAKLVGYYNHQDEKIFMGNDELYMGES